MHQGGLADFRHWYMRENHKTWRQAHLSATTSWKNHPIQHKYHWYVIKMAMSIVNRSELRGCVRHRVRLAPKSTYQSHAEANMPGTLQPDEDLLALGLLLTYQPTLGIDDPEVRSMIRDGLRGDELRCALQTRRPHRAYFQGLLHFIQQLRDTLGFASCCASMEMGDQSRFAAQVHCHAYIGFLRKDSTLTFAKQVPVRRSALMFCNVKPYVVATRGLRGRRLQDSEAQAMHYVVGPKSSGLFRATDLEPVQDALVTLQVRALNFVLQSSKKQQ
jgi:uncharacterized protein YjhX (UPF0386 family)